MGIKIVSQPIGAPILAAASTAMAQANQRTAERQSEMWQQQVEHKYRTKAVNEANDFNFGRQQAMAPIPLGVQGNLRASTAYGKLQDEARNIYSGLTIDPHSEEAKKRLAEIAADMAMLREVNPDPSPEEEFDKGRIFLDPSGSRIGPDGMPYTKMPEGGSELRRDPKTGAWSPPPLNPTEEAKRKADEKAAEKETAAAQKEAERVAAAKEKAAQSWVDDQKTFANDERKRKLDALKDKEGDHTAEIDKINSEYQQRLESLNNYMQNYGLRQPESQPPVAEPIPTGSELVGGALGPNFPPSQTTPGGGVLKTPLPPGTPASGSFPVGADPYKTNEQNWVDLYQSYLNKGMSPQEAERSVSKHWTAGREGLGYQGDQKGGFGPNEGAGELLISTESQDAGVELTKMMDDMQKSGKKFEDLTPAEQARWIELERIYKGE